MSLALPDPVLDLDEPTLQARFESLQARLVPLWKAIESLEDEGAQTIVVVPSLTVDYAALEGSVLQAYEERFLFLLLLLRQPRARLIYVTSQPILPQVVDYYLGLLPGVISSHARERLFLLAPHDGAPQPLSVKLLQRPRLLSRRSGALIPEPERAHTSCRSTPPATSATSRCGWGSRCTARIRSTSTFGTKSGCRKLFREAGISLPDGLRGSRLDGRARSTR